MRDNKHKEHINESNCKPNWAKGKKLNFVTNAKPKDKTNGDFLTKGYSKLEHHPHEEQYTDENALYFHETDDGFLEKNSYLDRI